MTTATRCSLACQMPINDATNGTSYKNSAGTCQQLQYCNGLYLRGLRLTGRSIDRKRYIRHSRMFIIWKVIEAKTKKKICLLPHHPCPVRPWPGTRGSILLFKINDSHGIFRVSVKIFDFAVI